MSVIERGLTTSLVSIELLMHPELKLQEYDPHYRRFACECGSLAIMHAEIEPDVFKLCNGVEQHLPRNPEPAEAA